MSCPRSQRGNVLIYILIAIVLFGALIFAVSSSIRGGMDTGEQEKSRLAAGALMEYSDQAKVAVQRMKLDGTPTASLSFLRPGEAGYTTAPHTAKVFHPEGGGLPYKTNWQDLDDSSAPTSTAVVAIVRNVVQGVGSTAEDIVFSVSHIGSDACSRLQQTVRGTSTAYAISAAFSPVFETGATDLDNAVCASCVGVQAACVVNGGVYTFYRVIDVN